MTPEHFAEHLEVLQRCSRVRLGEIKSSGRFSKRGVGSVAVTFDDGYADNLHHAARLLERYAMPATFFIATGYVDGSREFWWDELEKAVLRSPAWPGPLALTAAGQTRSFQLGAEAGRLPLYLSLYEFLQPLSHDARREFMDQLLAHSGQSSAVRPSHRVMTSAELVKLQANGLFELGAHTVTHPKLASQAVETQAAEILNSKLWLEKLQGRRVTAFSYPYGAPHHYSRVTVAMVRNAGFTHAYTTAAHAVQNTDSPWELPRFNVTDMDGEQFEKFLFAPGTRASAAGSPRGTSS